MTEDREMYVYDGKAIKVKLTENTTHRVLCITTKSKAPSMSTCAVNIEESLLNLHHVQLQSRNVLCLMQTVTRMDARIMDALGISLSHEEFQHIHKAQDTMLTQHIKTEKLQRVREEADKQTSNCRIR